MTATILTLLAALIPFAIWLYKRASARKDDRQYRHELRRQQMAREVIRNDEAAANRSLDDDLDELRSLQSDRRGQNRSPSQSP